MWSGLAWGETPWSSEPEATVGAGVTVTPGTRALVLATFAAVVTATANVTVTPATKALSLATFAPTVTATAHQTVTPGTASLSLTTFAPTVTGTAGMTVVPGTASLLLSTFAPTVTVEDEGDGVLFSVPHDFAAQSLPLQPKCKSRVRLLLLLS